jgi:multisubunit Na+/H+ antiporter MnhB subunit
MILFGFFLSVLLSPFFNIWENKEVAKYYIGEGFEKTSSANIVNSIVWDFRSFDTLGEETVLFTAAVGVFTVITFGMKRKRSR